MTGSQTRTPDISFTRLTDFFLAEVRKGTAPSIDHFVQAFPHLANEIRETFPTLAILEKALGNSQESAQPEVAKLSNLGGCKILEEIGSGAMGVVYRAHQQELDRTVAIKVISLGVASASGLIERFELERHAMARVDHPNVVPVYNYGHNDQHAFLVMKYIDGRSLDKLLQQDADYRSQALLAQLQGDWHFFATMAAKVADGLQHTHELGLVHRDIKPANLLLDLNRKVWITDFGLAKIYDFARSVSRTGDAIGTPRYMAPEQLRGVCDPRSDIYSLGITLYELAGGCRAWENHSLQTITSQRASLELADVRQANPEVPEGLAKIIMKACEFSPENRYQTCQELRIVLERFASGIPHADRRKRNRDCDAVYRKKRRWYNAMIITAGAATFAGGLIAVPLLKAARTPPPAPAPVRSPAAVNFIERLADPSQGSDLPQVLHDFVKDSIDESSAEFHLSEDEKQQIADQFRGIVSGHPGEHHHPQPAAKPQQVQPVKKRTPQPAVPQQPTGQQLPGNGQPERVQLPDFLDGYRQTTLPTATKVMSYVRVIEKSGLSRDEQSAAFETLRQLAKLVINRKVSEADAQKWIADLTNGKSVTVSEMEKTKVSDQALRDWLASVRQRIKATPGATPNEEFKLAEELKRAHEAIQKNLQPKNNTSFKPQAGK